MDGLTLFERRVLDACLAGDDSRLDVLRMQAASAMVAEREHTGVGAYITLKVPDGTPALCAGSIILGDVNLDVAGVANGVATLLYVTSGKLDFIEFATYDDDWPEDPSLVSVGYLQWVPSSSGAFSGVPVKERDPETLAWQLQEREA
ncbi:hypothetical protein [Agrilutibacter solisilvae]|uniref:Uncharacterized protein n=1 Tax=Agrilutibacter solisilvae TaxID=2763317 RepID=A0A974Y3X1_9GAMM|nr:hypothetical protein [Lysobacter solisilvae]QSX77386.1 hypothetical protein I8J32_011500 [Lysobacter solisilvae]